MGRQPPRAPRTPAPRGPDAPAAGEPPTLLTTAEVALLLRVHPKQVYRLLARGLPRRRVGSEWRFRREDVLRWSAGEPALEPTGARTAPRAGPPPLLASNGDVAVALLLAATRAAADAWVGAVEADRATALSLLRSGRALAVGYHGATFPPRVPEGRLARLHLVRREVGLVGAPGTHPRIEDLATARLADRRASAGVRATLDRALARAGLDAAAVHARGRECATHLDVACAVARREADVGVATHAWANRLGLAFAPLETEDYGVLFLADQMGRPEAVRLCETAQGRALRERLAAEAGYDASDAGAIRFDPDAPVGAAT